MDYEQKQISCSENFQMAIDRCCEAQIDCVKQMAKATCEVWSSVMVCYVAGMTKGLGGVMKCYIAGVEGFCKTFETVGEDLCDKRAKVYKCEYHEDCMTSEAREKEEMDYWKAKIARAEFLKTMKTKANKLDDEKGEDLASYYKNLKDTAEDLGKKKAREAHSEFLETMENMAKLLCDEKGPGAVADYFKKLKTVAEKPCPEQIEAQAESSQRTSEET